MKAQQQTMFSQGEDLPLFSGTPLIVTLSHTNPPPQAPQAQMFACQRCCDTGHIYIPIKGQMRRVHCTCAAGGDAMKESQG